MLGIVLTALGAVLFAVGISFYLRTKKELAALAVVEKKQKRKKTLFLVLVVISVYMVLTGIVHLLYPASESEGIQVKIWAERVELFGFSISKSVIWSWVIMAVLVVLALILRFTVLRRMQETPKGLQNVLEALVGAVSDYTESQAKGLGNGLPAYLFSLVLYMVGCALLEACGVRAPTSDITVTFGMALITFFLINYYGIRRKGVGGRLKGLASPTPIVFPLRIVSDIAVPVSLACRLFGNMLGGMIVMDLLYTAMGSFAVGLPSVVGLG